MTASSNLSNRRVTLAARPTARPGPENFSTDEVAVREPGPGEVLLESVYLSVDPAMRVWISDQPGYVEPIEIGEVMRCGGIGRVLVSNDDALAPGDLVQGRLGWQSHPTLEARYLMRLDLELGSALDWIGPLGGTALTAYFGMHHIGRLETTDSVLVSAAAGGVGQIASQIARIQGARVVGIAGGEEKCAFLRETLRLDDAIDYRAEPDIAAAIARACPEGIDLYFDNVGGPTLDGALAHLRLGARVAVCGRISQTASETLYGVRNLGQLIGKRARIEGFLVSDFAERFEEARAWLSSQIKAGKLTQRLHVLDGLDQAPEGLAMLFRSENTGKLVVRCADD